MGIQWIDRNPQLGALVLLGIVFIPTAMMSWYYESSEIAYVLSALLLVVIGILMVTKV